MFNFGVISSSSRSLEWGSTMMATTMSAWRPQTCFLEDTTVVWSRWIWRFLKSYTPLVFHVLISLLWPSWYRPAWTVWERARLPIIISVIIIITQGSPHRHNHSKNYSTCTAIDLQCCNEMSSDIMGEDKWVLLHSPGCTVQCAPCTRRSLGM